MTGAVNERNMSQKFISPFTAIPLALRVNLLITAVGSEASRSGASRVVTLVNLGVGVTELDRNVPLQFVLEPHSLHSRDSLHDGTLAWTTVALEIKRECPTRIQTAKHAYRERRDR